MCMANLNVLNYIRIRDCQTGSISSACLQYVSCYQQLQHATGTVLIIAALLSLSSKHSSADKTAPDSQSTIASFSSAEKLDRLSVCK